MCLFLCVLAAVWGARVEAVVVQQGVHGSKAAQDSCYQGELSTWHQGKMCFSPIRLCLEIIVFICVFCFSNHHVCKWLVRQVSLGNN